MFLKFGLFSRIQPTVMLQLCACAGLILWFQSFQEAYLCVLPRLGRPSPVPHISKTHPAELWQQSTNISYFLICPGDSQLGGELGQKGLKTLQWCGGQTKGESTFGLCKPPQLLFADENKACLSRTVIESIGLDMKNVYSY